MQHTSASHHAEMCANHLRELIMLKKKSKGDNNNVEFGVWSKTHQRSHGVNYFAINKPYEVYIFHQCLLFNVNSTVYKNKNMLVIITVVC